MALRAFTSGIANGDFSIKAQNKPITWFSTCKIFCNSATVPSYHP